MTIKTLVGYLLGQRDSIREIAASRHALWLGLIFVISAGFAREYDGEDLLHEPWHLGIPLVASLGTSFLLFCLLRLFANVRESPEFTFARGYRAFLSLYWMTAPLAWLYAIPVERFLSAAGATRANLWLLGIVAAWRVVLMVRVVSVLFGVSVRRALFPVLLFADTVTLILLYLTPLPVFSLMGGIRLSENEHIIQGTAFATGIWGVLTWPVWLIGSLVVLARRRGGWKPAFPPASSDGAVCRPVWAFAAASLLVWIPVLFVTQPEQQLRRSVESDLNAGRIEAALATMSAHDRSDFPPHWDPPPRIGYGQRMPKLVDVLHFAMSDPTADWVRGLYLEKLVFHTGGKSVALEVQDESEFDRLLGILEKQPQDSEQTRILLRQTGRILQRPPKEENSQWSDQTQRRVKRILDRIPKESPEHSD